MGALKGDNLLILVSKGGKTDELIPLVSIAKAKGAKIALVTANRESELAKESDALLLLPDVPESDRYGVMSTASFAATIAIFDALMMGIMEEKGIYHVYAMDSKTGVRSKTIQFNIYQYGAD